MLSLKLITTGLLREQHDIIGYVINDEPAVLIQPKDDTKFDYEAMHDINGLPIPKLKELGKNREESLKVLANRLEGETLLVWYAPFIKDFLKSEDIEVPEMIDLYVLAKQKDFNPANYTLAQVYEEAKVDNLFDLYEYLKQLPEPKRVRRV